jgi:hypothetical protein
MAQTIMELSYGNGFSRILIWVRDNTIPGQLFKIVGELSKPGALVFSKFLQNHKLLN